MKHSIPERIRYPITDSGESRTEQCHASECNINGIIARYKATGFLPPESRTPMFADVSDVPDYATAKNRQFEADQRFDDLPAKVKERFKNDPMELVSFVLKPENQKEAIQLGLIPEPEQKAKAPEPAPATPANEVTHQAAKADVTAA